MEGDTEVDVVSEGEAYLIFVEAKLHNGIAERTKYDLKRNQIIRDIDCVIEEAGARLPNFWMFVRGRDSHAKPIDRYSSEPAALAEELPHRDPGILELVAKSIVVIEWRETLQLVQPSHEIADVLVELHQRVG